MKRYLITGGAGFLGINLIRYLKTKEPECKIRSLDIAPFEYPERRLVEAVTGDIRDAAAVEKAMSGIKIAIHCAAALPLYKPKDIYDVDVNGTRNVLAAAERAGAERVIHISSTAVYGIPDHHPIMENDLRKGVGPYGEAKIEAEDLCLEYRRAGMCVPILRPKSFVGPERLGIFALLYEWAADGKNFPIIGNGRNRYQLLDVEDLCAAIYLCMTKEKNIVNDTFNVGAKEFATLREDYQAVLDRAGRGGKIISFPAAPAIAVLRILEALKLSPIYRWVYETAGRDSFVSIEKAERVLGFQPRFSNREALIRNFEWYCANRSRFTGRSGISHRLPWRQGALKLLKLFF